MYRLLVAILLVYSQLVLCSRRAFSSSLRKSSMQLSRPSPSSPVAPPSVINNNINCRTPSFDVLWLRLHRHSVAIPPAPSDTLPPLSVTSHPVRHSGHRSARGQHQSPAAVDNSVADKLPTKTRRRRRRSRRQKRRATPGGDGDDSDADIPVNLLSRRRKQKKHEKDDDEPLSSWECRYEKYWRRSSSSDVYPPFIQTGR